MQNIVIIGSGRYTGVVLDIILAERKYKVDAILCDFAESETQIMGFNIGKLSLLDNNLPRRGIVAVGDNYRRERYVADILARYPDFEFITTIHPTAVVSNNVKLGFGSAIHAFSVIKYNASIGNHCDINCHTTIAHDVEIGDYSTVGAGGIVGGYTKIGFGSSINLGSIIKDRIVIGDYVVIGMASVVTKPITSNTFSCGNPARIMRKREKNEGFL